MAIYEDITETIGNTPMVRLHRVVPGGSNVYAKIERGNPGGSIKDRPVLSMLNAAEADGILRKGGCVVEPTSGNTGIALAMISAARGYDAVIIMPDTMSKERALYMRAYGAEVIFTPGSEGMQGAIDKAEEVSKARGGFVLGQFDNPANPASHRTATGREILTDIPDVDFIVGGLGTGGTMSGIAMAVRDAGSDARIIGVEPAESPLLTCGRAGPHKIQGIGANLVPKNLDRDMMSEVRTVKGDDAIAMTVRLAREEGIFSGISSGAAVSCAAEIAESEHGRKIVVILPDGGEKYISAGIFD